MKSISALKLPMELMWTLSMLVIVWGCNRSDSTEISARDSVPPATQTLVADPVLQSGVSNSISPVVTPVPLPPEVTGLSVTQDSSSALTVSWISGGGNTGGFKVVIANKFVDGIPTNCSAGISTGTATSW